MQLMRVPVVIAALAILVSCSKAELDRVHPVTSEDHFMVTPRWSPDGSRLAVSRRGGIGLHLLEISSGKLTQVDPVTRGALHFAPDGRSLAFLDPERSYQELDLRSGKLKKVPRPGYAVRPGDFESPELSVDFDEYSGSITVRIGEEEMIVAEDDAWGVKVSSRGSVAWCEGHLASATLFVFDPERGEMEVGPGAQPSWSPDGSRLIYARPEGGAQGEVVGSDLYLFDMETASSRRLTNTPGVTEMEPSVSPDGNRLALADWRSGRILVGDLRP